MLALSVRQPYAELILRGLKTVEYRTRATRVVGERFLIYATKKAWPVAGARPASNARDPIWSTDLAVPGATPGGPPLPPAWMMELAKLLILDDLPRGVIVGSAVIEKVTRGNAGYEWHLGDVERANTFRKPTRQPQPVWFKPF